MAPILVVRVIDQHSASQHNDSTRTLLLWLVIRDYHSVSQHNDSTRTLLLWLVFWLLGLETTTPPSNKSTYEFWYGKRFIVGIGWGKENHAVPSSRLLCVVGQATLAFGWSLHIVGTRSWLALQVEYKQRASKYIGHGLELWGSRSPESLQGWNIQHVPGAGVLPDDSAWEGVAVDLDASWNYLIFIWAVISCTVREHWGRVGDYYWWQSAGCKCYTPRRKRVVFFSRRCGRSRRWPVSLWGLAGRRELSVGALQWLSEAHSTLGWCGNVRSGNYVCLFDGVADSPVQWHLVVVSQFLERVCHITLVRILVPCTIAKFL